MIKIFIKKILFKLLEFIEKWEYRNLNIDEKDISKKIVSTNKINLNVLADTGYVSATHIHKTQPYTIYDIVLENGNKLSCADNHIVFKHDLSEIFVKDLTINDYLYTEFGKSKVSKITKSKNKVSMFDLSIDSDEHRYYTNGILSHNTINASITILYYCIFERNKNILIAGNIAKTSEEILNKIKDIYYLLPFWLKPSVLVWNVSQITFGDTKVRIKTSSVTKTAAIGNTVDLLYLDEFAHVQSNIADSFYKSILPTVSSILNSKIIITSTPNGYNLFWKLLNDAERVAGDKEKNTFVSKRVYWHQVPGRFVTYLRLNEWELAKHKITNQDLYNWVKSFGFEEEILDDRGLLIKEGLKIVTNYETNKVEIHIPNKSEYLPYIVRSVLEEKEWENPLSDYFRSVYYTKQEYVNDVLQDTKIKLLDLCDISSWKEDAIKDIGSLEAFNQEYDLQFLSGSKMVLDSNTMSKIENSLVNFEYIELENLKQKTFVSLENLTWIKDRPELFNLADVKKYWINISVDISEGLNGDYSVINIFRVLPKQENEWMLNINSLYDFFKLEQIGIFHSNITSVQELAEILYLLCFEFFDDSKIGVVLESNNWGNELTKTMREMFNGRNKYSSHIFFRYKHRQDDIKPEIGIKLRQNKNMFVKEYQKRIKQGDIIVHHRLTLQEMTKFIKKDSASGYTFQAEIGGKDDIVMTIVELSTVFENVLFHSLINRFFSEIDIKIKTEIEKRLLLAPQKEGNDYTSIINASRISNMRRNVTNQPSQNGWGLLGGNNSGWSSLGGNSENGWNILGK